LLTVEKGYLTVEMVFVDSYNVLDDN
jgi:hypothetical protein